ncbi:SprT-like domain-containing protein [Micromonospora sp. NPDC093244]|uniref:SprT-like domain-containing protein n=1 Tax=Micromonospora sp. NPDC093244 TaxID=3155071 RepID=UPI003428E5DB
MDPQYLPLVYDRLNAVCFGGRLRPALIRIHPWILSKDSPGARLAGAWDAEGWSVGLDRALLDHPDLLFGVLLHEMVHQDCWQQDRITGHGPLFIAAAAKAAASLGVQPPTPGTAEMWPEPVPRQLLKEI